MLLINLIFEFCVVQGGCTPRAWLPSDLATSPLVCNLYLTVVCREKKVACSNLGEKLGPLGNLPLHNIIDETML